MRKFLSLILIFILVASLCACDLNTPQGTQYGSSSLTPTSNNAILEDIKKVDSIIHIYELDATIEIDKRQTNPDDKTDYVWATVVATNDITTYTTQYHITYVLYNEGWLRENIEQLSSKISNTKNIDVSEEKILQDIKEHDSRVSDYSYDNISLSVNRSDDSLESTTRNVSVSLCAENSTYIYKPDYNLVYTWDVAQGWVFNDFKRTKQSLQPLIACPISIPRDYIAEEYPDLTPIGSDDFSRSMGSYDYFYYCNTTGTEDSISYTYSHELRCTFSIEDGWHVYYNHTTRTRNY